MSDARVPSSSRSRRASDTAMRAPSGPVAVIDIGASAVRLVVAEIEPGRPPAVLEEACRGLLIGRDTFSSGRIGPSTMDAAVRAVAGFREHHGRLRRGQRTGPSRPAPSARRPTPTPFSIACACARASRRDYRRIRRKPPHVSRGARSAAQSSRARRRACPARRGRRRQRRPDAAGAHGSRRSRASTRSARSACARGSPRGTGPRAAHPAA